ncbi:MAG: M48 family metallopeptidase [Ignavibacterium sp.]|nr:M48 family metallopeptidase [Ignavibacterium sp.]MCX7611998.1 M48 family metallopeptidase [Ignavibacterium sp.]MDW8376158.1 M48 family metallopeptidase [Ignavibacteriales bacterium]
MKMTKIIFLIFLITSQIIYSQDLIKNILKTVDQVNQELLNITAPSDEEENKIGEQLDKEIMKDKKTVNDYKFQIKIIFDKIKKQTDRKKINYRYSIIKDKDFNAYTIAGGKVYLLTGLIDELEKEEELAFVIAHEIAHNELKHCIKKVQYAAKASEINPLLGNLVQIAYSIYHLPFSKEEELEADKRAVELMKKAGYDKEGAISFFKKLQQKEKQYRKENKTEENDFISTHPNTEERIKKIEKM